MRRKTVMGRRTVRKSDDESRMLPHIVGHCLQIAHNRETRKSVYANQSTREELLRLAIGGEIARCGGLVHSISALLRLLHICEFEI